MCTLSTICIRCVFDQTPPCTKPVPSHLKPFMPSQERPSRQELGTLLSKPWKMCTSESCKFPVTIPCFQNLLTLSISFSHTAFHGRKRRLVVKPETDNASLRDSLVVTKDGIFEVFGTEQSPWEAYPVILEPFRPECGIDLPWYLVGIHRYYSISMLIYRSRFHPLFSALLAMTAPPLSRSKRTKSWAKPCSAAASSLNGRRR